MYGSERGARGNSRPYRDRDGKATFVASATCLRPLNQGPVQSNGMCLLDHA
jgi:hypothetical protein